MNLYYCTWIDEHKDENSQLVYADGLRAAKDVIRCIDHEDYASQEVHWLKARLIPNEDELRKCPLFWQSESQIFVEDQRDYFSDHYKPDGCYGEFLPDFLINMRVQWRREENAANERAGQLTLWGRKRRAVGAR